MKTILNKSIFSLCLLFVINSLFAQRFSPAIDTYIDQNAPTTAKGAANEIIVRNNPNTNRIAFMQFNLGAFNDSISKAELCLYLYSTTAVNKTEVIEVYEVTSGTVDNSITWDNFNAGYTLSATPITTLTISTGPDVATSYGWYRFDIKNLVRKLAATVGSDKKIVIALKNQTTNLLFTFYSNNSVYPYYRPYLLTSPATVSGLVERSRTSVYQDGFVNSGAPTTVYNGDYLQVQNLYNSTSKYSFIRFEVPSQPLNDDSRITLKTKVKASNCVNVNNYVVDLNGVNDLDNATDVNTLTWNTKPTNYTLLRSRIFTELDKTNESDVEWDVTNYVKAAKVAGSTYINFCMQVYTGGLGGTIGFYSLNGGTNVPEIIVSDSGTTALINRKVNLLHLIISGNTISQANHEAFSGKIISVLGDIEQEFKLVSKLDISVLPVGVHILSTDGGDVFKFIKQ